MKQSKILQELAEAEEVSPKQEDLISENVEKLHALQLENKNTETNINLRLGLVPWMKKIVIAWLIFTGVIVIVDLVFTAIFGKALSDAVVCALLTTTTANVLGLAVIVLKGLFPQHKK